MIERGFRLREISVNINWWKDSDIKGKKSKLSFEYHRNKEKI